MLTGDIYKNFMTFAGTKLGSKLTPDYQMTITEFIEILSMVLDHELNYIDIRLIDIEKN